MKNMLCSLIIAVALFSSCSKKEVSSEKIEPCGYVVTYYPIGLPPETVQLGFEDFPMSSCKEYLPGRDMTVGQVREQNRQLRKKCEDGVKESTPAHTTVWYHYIQTH